MNTIESNVISFLDKASADHGKLCAERFSQSVFHELYRGEIKSPIEQIFFIALSVMSDLYSLKLNECADFEKLEECGEIYYKPQFKIGNYFVDFILAYKDFHGFISKVVVELDGHDFHDKDKQQRAYEKSRDRFLSRQGVITLHFTGTELYKDPYKSVLEAFVSLGAAHQQFLDQYDPSNPLGVA